VYAAIALSLLLQVCNLSEAVCLNLVGEVTVYGNPFSLPHEHTSSTSCYPVVEYLKLKAHNSQLITKLNGIGTASIWAVGKPSGWTARKRTEKSKMEDSLTESKYCDTIYQLAIQEVQ
jgi:hypothetical protein